MRKLLVLLLGLMLAVDAWAQEAGPEIPKRIMRRAQKLCWYAELDIKHEDFREALEYSQKVVGFYESNHCRIDYWYAQSVAYIGISNTFLGNHEEALRVFEYLMSRKSIPLFLIDETWFLAYLSQAESNIVLGNYGEAEVCCEKLYALVNEKFVENKLANFLANNVYGYMYLSQGDYQKAIPYFEKALDISMSIKKGYQQQTIALSNLGLAYYHSSEYAKSLESLTRCRQIYDACNFDKKYQHMLYQNLGVTHLAMGDYKNALDDFEVAQDCAEKYFGDTSQYYADVLIDISVACRQLHENSIAKDMLEGAISIMENNNSDSAKLAMAYDNMALLLYAEDKYADALQYSNKVQKIFSERKSLNSTDYWRSRNWNLFFRLTAGEKVELAQITDCIDSTAKYLGKYNAVTVQALNNIVNYYVAFPDEIIEPSLFERYASDNVDMIDLQLSQFTEKERQSFWSNWNWSVNTWDLALNLHTDNPNSNAVLYNFALWTKGMLLRNNSVFYSRALASDDSRISKLNNQLSDIRIKISNLESTPKESHSMDINVLYNRRDSIEHILVKELADNQIYTNHIDYKQVRDRLKDNDLAVEFVTYLKCENNFHYAKSHTYGALVLRKDYSEPVYYELFDESEIDDVVFRNPNSAYTEANSKMLYQYVWSKILAHCKPGDNIFFAPSGKLNNLSIENLMDSSNVYVCDKYNFHRLSSTREIIDFQQGVRLGNIMLIGGVDYGDGGHFRFLEGSRNELDNISEVLSNNNLSFKSLSGADASEDAFKRLNKSEYDIIHLATHGFFLKDSVAISKNMLVNQLDETTVSLNPLLRSGLALAGANRAWKGERIPNGVDDGILTAQEIKDLDLSKTQMVVLSACETGLGDINTDGVFGLQRAFKSAGVQTIVMSLWKVSDNATSLLMTEFYKWLIATGDRHKAFLQAKEAVRARFPEAYYWAGFVMLD